MAVCAVQMNWTTPTASDRDGDFRAASFNTIQQRLTVGDGVENFSGEESADFAAEGCGVANGVGGFNRTHERLF